MKCAKCGYISFDHLSSCKKCGTSLNQSRQGLGFSDVKPAPPEFVKALIEEGAPVGSSATTRPPASTGGLGLQLEANAVEGSVLSVDSAPIQQKTAATIVAAPPHDEWTMDSQWLEQLDKQPGAEMPEVDDLVLELVDEEAPVKVAPAAPATSLDADRGLALHADIPDLEDFALDLGHEDASPHAEPPRPAGSMASGKVLPPLDLHADESLDDLVFEDLPLHGEEELSLHADDELSLPEAADDLDLFARPPEKPTAAPGAAASDLDDMVLELGDDTLDFADMELEESTAKH